MGRRGADVHLSRHGQRRRIRPGRVFRGRIDYWDAIDPDLLAPVAAPRPAPSSRSRRRRTSRTSACCARSACRLAARMSFWIDRDTEFPWDFVFFEVHTVGQDDWTTLADLNGHTTQDTGLRLPVLARHPSVPDALPDRHPQGLRPGRHDRRLVGGDRRQRSGRELGGRSGRLRRVRCGGLDLLRERRHRPAQRCLRR